MKPTALSLVRVYLQTLRGPAPVLVDFRVTVEKGAALGNEWEEELGDTGGE
jgi:hypothetical protein